MYKNCLECEKQFISTNGRAICSQRCRDRRSREYYRRIKSESRPSNKPSSIFQHEGDGHFYRLTLSGVTHLVQETPYRFASSIAEAEEWAKTPKK